MINRVVLVGRLTKDPELRYTPSGAAVARFTIAVNRTFANQQGEKQADFINCVVWRKQAENTANFLKKGSLAGIEGRIQTGSYEGQDGKRVYTTEVVADSVQFLEPRGAAGDRPQGQQQYGGQPSYGGEQSYSQAPQQNNYQQQPSYQQNQSPSQQNYTRVDEDPFANNNGGPIEVSEDDLPF
ncbi:single-stranded DNA-binding protein [Viridibacillus sp. FSL R5-0477]|uniref:Single-stranded DNA-binding protein n=1 Tax=Viridibacillus arenosi FSL R5-213 TaxID=1227360 RepID=W4F876_9BACL|nr:MULTISPECIES: single-stranded DNA-binding protein [Viridibacillus]ETT88537.1 single-stranded DNA-binding protein [Viridibacillus arenosi FSL R5-213]OMC81093.1 single-stranded DNA-binding protein [Viridibacillus sp. FSL H8-0123]OMC85155.1 single-stranded DNA-binding protein [Viridibacillus sp. FSL H7-0596]OMC90155.1 single-stranded DNA-binding protein [Viridibacillus arenosi]